MIPTTRRTFLQCGFATAALLPLSCAHPTRGLNPEGSRRKIESVAGPFDAEMLRFMAERRIPGGALAVFKDRRLVYAQGYGWADRERQIPASARSLFRIASLSKPLTAVAVLKLAQEGRINLDGKAFGLLPAASVPGGTVRDSRVDRITVRQLLQHTGGWDRDLSFDPMFRPAQIARALDLEPPPGPADVIRYMLGQPLEFEPGSRYAYSNFGYCVLGRILERVAGQPYESFVREQVLAPCGIHRMRLGRTLDERHAPDEVRYYMDDSSEAAPVYPSVAAKVPWPYGGFNLEAMDAHGGWIASVVDLARFAAPLDNPDKHPVLRSATLNTMSAPPAPPAWRDADGKLGPVYYGCGWMVRPMPSTGRANFWHTGSLPGTFALLVHRHDGVGWAALFNQRSSQPQWPDAALDPALHRAAAAVRSWPDHNLFSEVE